MPSLSGEILLLALDDEKGTVGMNASTTLDTALAGGQLLELAIAKRLTIEDKRIVLLDGPEITDPVLDAALERLQEETRPRKAETMIPKLTKGLRKRLLAQLAEEGVLREEERRLLGF